MSEPLRIVKRKFLVSLAGGEPVLNSPKRRKTTAKPTAGWKPIRWRCRLCKRPKKWPGQICPCVEHKRWRDATFEWRPKEKRPHTIIFFCHCGQNVDNCQCPDDPSPRYTHIQYEEGGLSGWPVEGHNVDYNLVMMCK